MTIYWCWRSADCLNNESTMKVLGWLLSHSRYQAIKELFSAWTSCNFLFREASPLTQLSGLEIFTRAPGARRDLDKTDTRDVCALSGEQEDGFGSFSSFQDAETITSIWRASRRSRSVIKDYYKPLALCHTSMTSIRPMTSLAGATEESFGNENASNFFELWA